MSVKKKDVRIFLWFWWRMIDGYCASIGYVFGRIAYGLDMTWNVNGEII